MFLYSLVLNATNGLLVLNAFQLELAQGLLESVCGLSLKGCDGGARSLNFGGQRVGGSYHPAPISCSILRTTIEPGFFADCILDLRL
ncbi:hypothetical protein C8Q76DRAFT_731776 [Earliella scabrosa]|nr:hypothetical protein C8Q76DRAFT_731776 [Earliella scabrosa]